MHAPGQTRHVVRPSIPPTIRLTHPAEPHAPLEFAPRTSKPQTPRPFPPPHPRASRTAGHLAFPIVHGAWTRAIAGRLSACLPSARPASARNADTPPKCAPCAFSFEALNNAHTHAPFAACIESLAIAPTVQSTRRYRFGFARRRRVRCLDRKAPVSPVYYHSIRTGRLSVANALTSGCGWRRRYRPSFARSQRRPALVRPPTGRGSWTLSMCVPPRL
ncbi:hypothetical protein HYPSUDRAFT_68489 [Hypholoma sublateritium FD-334 SS-4]|uniref:Uncharacterized protein n=1 Tax=Hypholoma sublateritium (strain FD-334 SS-4) TaxID=945553 RepID=A0A0D2L175_HYPSF|nr:hypothetical protein HYPSUDRAFT_68489 [Hypholoma sublateritium FD-334 SS-4]